MVVHRHMVSRGAEAGIPVLTPAPVFPPPSQGQAPGCHAAPQSSPPLTLESAQQTVVSKSSIVTSLCCSRRKYMSSNGSSLIDFAVTNSIKKRGVLLFLTQNGGAENLRDHAVLIHIFLMQIKTLQKESETPVNCRLGSISLDPDLCAFKKDTSLNRCCSSQPKSLFVLSFQQTFPSICPVQSSMQSPLLELALQECGI